jgi:hypothetical protein
MENNKTAVEWLADELTLPEYGDNPQWVIQVIQKAKQMEEDQIIKAYLEGAEMGEMFNNENRAFTTDAKQYYEKIKSGENV